LRTFISYALLLLACVCRSQSGTLVFNDSVMHTMYINTDLSNWFDSLEADYQANINIKGHPQKYFHCTVTFDGIVLDSCGFKEKGNASNSFISYGKKKPLKISFDEFKKQSLDGLKKFNLNNFTNDPSLVRDAVCMKLMREEGIFAPRTSYVKLFINNEYIGLYVIIENVGKTFLKEKYGSANNNGNLYKTDRGCQMWMTWLGEDKESYKNKNFQLTTNETTDDWSNFIGFVNFINFDRSDNFKAEFEKRFDVHSYLKILAIEKCVKSWDSYWGGGNNFFLYEHPDGMIRWIPWDMNETFQDIKVIGKTSLLDGYLIPTPQFDNRPLLARIFEYDEYKQEFLDNACQLVKGNFTVEHLGRYIVKNHELIDSAYKADTYRYNRYDDFKRSLTQRNEDEVSITKAGYALHIRYPGVFPLIQEQREWVEKQMKGWDRECVVSKKNVYNLNVFPNPGSDQFTIKNDQGIFDYAQIKLYDFSGRLCWFQDNTLIESNQYTFSVSTLAPGVYWLIKTSVDGSVGRAKVVIAR
jgi:spore coat protein H